MAILLFSVEKSGRIDHKNVKTKKQLTEIAQIIDPFKRVNDFPFRNKKIGSIGGKNMEFLGYIRGGITSKSWKSLLWILWSSVTLLTQSERHL
jgi:hypothetical protein